MAKEASECKYFNRCEPYLHGLSEMMIEVVCSGGGASECERYIEYEKLEQSVKLDEHPFGEWGKVPLPFP